MEHLASEHSAAGHWESVDFAALEAAVVIDVDSEEEDNQSVSIPSDDLKTNLSIEAVVADSVDVEVDGIDVAGENV